MSVKQLLTPFCVDSVLVLWAASCFTKENRTKDIFLFFSLAQHMGKPYIQRTKKLTWASFKLYRWTLPPVLDVAANLPLSLMHRLVNECFCRRSPELNQLQWEATNTVNATTTTNNNTELLYSAILWCTQTHCTLWHSPTFSKFYKHNTYNYDS